MPKIKSILIRALPPFSKYEIVDIPKEARLVVMLGPNGSGKTSILQALNVGANEWPLGAKGSGATRRVHIDCHDYSADLPLHLYLRTAYRAMPSFKVTPQQISDAMCNPTRVMPSLPANASDATTHIYSNYLALIRSSTALSLGSNKTWEEAVESITHPLQERLSAMFPGLRLLALSRQANEYVPPAPTFRFAKAGRQYEYSGLSGGEREVFDLLLDLELWAHAFPDALYCIDEPELHLHSALQSTLLHELMTFIPAYSQLWIATHSIGIIKKAMALHESNKADVVFLEFATEDIAVPQKIKPAVVNRNLWKRAFSVALHDLANLTTPSHIVICEGKPLNPPKAGKAKNPEFDAGVYREIFHATHPDTEFISAGGCRDVIADSIKLKAALEIVSPGARITRLLDRDNHSEAEVSSMRKSNQVLSRYSIESYLWGEEIIRKLIQPSGLPSTEAERILAVKATALGRPVGSADNASDCVKDIDHLIWDELKNIPQFRGKGTGPNPFASAMLVPLITPNTATFQQLKRDIFD